MSNDPENNDTLKDALKSYGLRQDIARIHKEMMPSLTASVKDRTPVRSIRAFALKVAAAILILVMGTGIFIYVTSTPENIFSSKYAPYEESPQRGNETGSSAIKSKFIQGQEFLRNGEPLKAIVIFTGILESNRTAPEKILNDDAEYYLALSYLAAGQPENALPLFQHIHDDVHHLYNDQVTSWFLWKVRIAAWKDK